MGLWSGCRCQVIEDIKSCHPEVKASESDKRLQSYVMSILRLPLQTDLECITFPSNIQKFSGRGPPDPPQQINYQ